MAFFCYKNNLISALRSSSLSCRGLSKCPWSARDVRTPWSNIWRKTKERKKQNQKRIKKRNLNKKLRSKKSAKKTNVNKRRNSY